MSANELVFFITFFSSNYINSLYNKQCFAEKTMNIGRALVNCAIKINMFVYSKTN